MEGVMFLIALVAIGAFVVSIIVGAQFSSLKLSVEELKRRLAESESSKSAVTAQPAPATRAVPLPPPLSNFVKPPPIPLSSPKITEWSPAPSLNWESILGVKLFAWIGGLALFLGVVFFVKYAFENNWITPLMRVVAGALVGAALIIVSLLPAVRRYRVPAQSLCVTGILILYADVYSAHSFYSLILLTAATVLMWMVTGVALVLATGLGAQSAAWLGVFGGFLTPVLFATNYDNPIALFGYISLLNCAVSAVSALQRWNYLVLLAALGSVLMEFTWAAGFFGPINSHAARIVFLTMEALFLAICIAQGAAKSDANWGVGATALAGFAALLFCFARIDSRFGYGWELVFPMLLLANAGLIAVAVAARSFRRRDFIAAIIAAALVFSWLTEWAARYQMFGSIQPLHAIAWYIALFLLFAVTPYFCGVDRVWPWMISAIAGPLQFWFVYHLMSARFPDDVNGLLPIAFAAPALIGVAYLAKIQHVDLSSADSRLAVQGAAVLAFVSLVFPVQFEREWITLGWASEGLALILLFRLIPNRRLRAVALIVLSAAFVRVAVNPAVLEYHARTRVPIWNWYLYAYGVAALCFFLSALCFSDPREKPYERNAKPLLYSLCGIVVFLLMNIEIADYFSIGPTLTFSFSGNFARDMSYTIAWSLFAFGLLVLGIVRGVRAARLVAIALLCVAFAKLFLHDLDSLHQLYRIGAFVTVAMIAIVASFVYQRFLSLGTKRT
jgi:uncharacterized membrane protein